MIKVKGIIRGQSVELLDRVSLKNGAEIELFLPEETVTDSDYQKAMRREIERMNKGFSLGGGPYYEKRDELHER